MTENLSLMTALSRGVIYYLFIPLQKRVLPSPSILDDYRTSRIRTIHVRSTVLTVASIFLRFPDRRASPQTIVDSLSSRDHIPPSGSTTPNLLPISSCSRKVVAYYNSVVRDRYPIVGHVFTILSMSDFTTGEDTNPLCERPKLGVCVTCVAEVFRNQDHVPLTLALPYLSSCED